MITWKSMLGYMHIPYYSILFISLVLEIEHRTPYKLSTINTTELCPSSLCCFIKRDLSTPRSWYSGEGA